MTERTPIRVLTVDDHPLFREGISTVIGGQPDMVLVGEASNGREAVDQFRRHKPDVTLMDLRLPDMSGISVMTKIRDEFSSARIVFLSTFDGDAGIQRALESGAWGYALKSLPPADLIRIIRKVFAGMRGIPATVAAQLAERVGEDHLTSREMEVLMHLGAGNRTRDIGERLFISEDTVKAHITQIVRKLGASNRTEALMIAARRGIIRL